MVMPVLNFDKKRLVVIKAYRYKKYKNGGH